MKMHKNILCTLLISTGFILAAPLSADFMYSFDNPDSGGPIFGTPAPQIAGPSLNYTNNGATITASGWSDATGSGAPGSPNNLVLFNHPSFTALDGIGTLAPSGFIQAVAFDGNGFVQLDLTNIASSLVNPLTISFTGNTIANWILSSGSILGTPGTANTQSGMSDLTLYTMASGDDILTVQAQPGAGGLLLQSLGATSAVGAPEPMTYLLLGTVVALALTRHRSKPTVQSE